MSMRKLVAVCAIAVCGWAPAAAQNQERYKVRLATIAMDGGMRDAVAGSGSATAVLAGMKLTINGTFEGLRSPATAARLHSGIAMGVRGAPLTEISITKGLSGTITGSVDLTADQVQSLRKGRLYIQISSERAPEGNLWGWLVR